MNFLFNFNTWALLAFATLPTAINQHPPGVSGVLRTLLFSVLLGLIAYVGAFWVMWIPVHFFWRRPYRALHKAAFVWGIACSLLLPAMYVVAISPGDTGGIIEVGLMILILVAGAVMSFLTLARSKREPRGRTLIKN